MTNQTRGRRITIEETGGFVGSNPGAHFRTRGEVELDRLPDDERSAVEQLLDRGSGAVLTQGANYRLSWEEDGQRHEIEVGSDDLTPSLRASLKTDLV